MKYVLIAVGFIGISRLVEAAETESKSFNAKVKINQISMNRVGLTIEGRAAEEMFDQLVALGIRANLQYDSSWLVEEIKNEILICRKLTGIGFLEKFSTIYKPNSSHLCSVVAVGAQRAFGGLDP